MCIFVISLFCLNVRVSLPYNRKVHFILSVFIKTKCKHCHIPHNICWFYVCCAAVVKLYFPQAYPLYLCTVIVFRSCKDRKCIVRWRRCVSAKSCLLCRALLWCTTYICVGVTECGAVTVGTWQWGQWQWRGEGRWQRKLEKIETKVCMHV